MLKEGSTSFLKCLESDQRAIGSSFCGNKGHNDLQNPKQQQNNNKEQSYLKKMDPQLMGFDDEHLKSDNSFCVLCHNSSKSVPKYLIPSAFLTEIQAKHVDVFETSDNSDNYCPAWCKNCISDYLNNKPIVLQNTTSSTSTSPFQKKQRKSNYGTVLFEAEEFPYVANPSFKGLDAQFLMAKDNSFCCLCHSWGSLFGKYSIPSELLKDLKRKYKDIFQQVGEESPIWCGNCILRFLLSIFFI